MVALFGVLACVNLSEASFKCPKGEDPRLSYAPSESRGVIVCGNQLKGERGGWTRMNQFDVFTVGFANKPKVLLHASEHEFYNVWAGYDEGVILERIVPLPIKDGDEPMYVSILRTKIKCARRGCQRRAPVCAVSGLDKSIQADAVDRAKTAIQKVKAGEKPDDRMISARLLVRALAGDLIAADLLKNLDSDEIGADTDLARSLEDHQDILKTVMRLGCLRK